MHIGSTMTYDPSTAQDGFVCFKDILGFIEARLLFSKTMRQRMVQVPLSLDYPYWVAARDRYCRGTPWAVRLRCCWLFLRHGMGMVLRQA